MPSTGQNYRPVEPSRVKASYGHVTPIFRQERDYHLYQARQNALREQNTQQELLEEALRKQEEERQAKEMGTTS